MASLFLKIDTATGQHSAVATASPGIWEKEVPSGTVNGSNTIFVLTYVPLSAGSTFIYVNGLMRSDYTIDLPSKTITFSTAPAYAQGILVAYLR